MKKINIKKLFCAIFSLLLAPCYLVSSSQKLIEEKFENMTLTNQSVAITINDFPEVVCDENRDIELFDYIFEDEPIATVESGVLKIFANDILLSIWQNASNDSLLRIDEPNESVYVICQSYRAEGDYEIPDLIKSKDNFLSRVVMLIKEHLMSTSDFVESSNDNILQYMERMQLKKVYLNKVWFKSNESKLLFKNLCNGELNQFNMAILKDIQDDIKELLNENYISKNMINTIQLLIDFFCAEVEGGKVLDLKKITQKISRCLVILLNNSQEIRGYICANTLSINHHMNHIQLFLNKKEVKTAVDFLKDYNSSQNIEIMQRLLQCANKADLEAIIPSIMYMRNIISYIHGIDPSQTVTFMANQLAHFGYGINDNIDKLSNILRNFYEEWYKLYARYELQYSLIENDLMPDLLRVVAWKSKMSYKSLLKL